MSGHRHTGWNDQTCGKCGKTADGLKRCGKCQIQRYCDRDCQKEHWMTHKLVCGSIASAEDYKRNYATSRDVTKNLDVPVADPFTRIDKGIWLHDRSQGDTFKLLIDTCRMRMADELTFEKKANPDSVFSEGVTSSIGAFRKFLDILETKHRELLPDWWNDEKRQECEQLGMDSNVWESLSAKRGKDDINTYYSDENMSMQFRMFGFFVYDRGISGIDAKDFLRVLVTLESGQFYFTDRGERKETVLFQPQ
ncbi:uncharacterized protein IWZ02DRAFT_507714 [Phyllosticta citriasiana]|uniref:MYND-type domain-containing protein n=1 Tax=Phyllosticta citriasiana TaxID=595635 RepID=A0ABR1KA80_9PEZI